MQPNTRLNEYYRCVLRNIQSFFEFLVEESGGMWYIYFIMWGEVHVHG